MLISERTVFHALGKDYGTRERAEAACIDAIGALLDERLNLAQLSPGQKIAVIEAITDEPNVRLRLTHLLSF